MSNSSGRSLGEDNFQIDASVLPTFAGSFGYGVTDTVDVGALVELQFGLLYSLWGKVALLEDSSDHAVAIQGGIFSGAGSTGAYIGPVWSYKRRKFEPYLNTRLNYVDWDPRDLNSDERDDLSFFTNSNNDISFTYLQAEIGANIWFTPKFALNLNGKILVFFDSDDVDSTTDVIPGVSTLFKF
jgi:hypothetical protein